MKSKWKNGKYIAYFQAYTNTYASVEELRKKYDEAINQDGVVALAIATRPDCLSKEVLDLLQEYKNKVYVWIELGLQTVDENTAKIINRGYSLKVFEEALNNLRNKDIDVVVHTIFGLPGEDEIKMMNTIEYLAQKDIQGIKIHLLHLMKGTPMVKLYEKGQLSILTKDNYIRLICEAITKLPPNIVIHRLTGDAPRNLLIEPKWSLKKWEVLNAIDSRMKEKGLHQGLYFPTNKNN
jgi:radical SAM protein (TIGR01212 family)